MRFRDKRMARIAGMLGAMAVLEPPVRAGEAPAATAMIAIPAGPFVMGDDHGPADERPRTTVMLDAFAIDRTPVTNAQFAAFLDRFGARDALGNRLFDDDDPDARIHRRAGRWHADEGFERHPVVEVTWIGARAYCASVGRRLPTEAEWEKAARGNDARRYPWGNEAPDATRARFSAGWNATVPVGSYPRGASPYGVLDMAGNAWHWVASAYQPYPYVASDGRETDTPGPVRATRGGGHDSAPDQLTTTQRGRTLSRNPAAGHHNIGFRCAQ